MDSPERRQTAAVDFPARRDGTVSVVLTRVGVTAGGTSSSRGGGSSWCRCWCRCTTRCGRHC